MGTNSSFHKHQVEDGALTLAEETTRPRLAHVTDFSSGSMRARVWSVAACDLRSERPLEQAVSPPPPHLVDYAAGLARALPGEALRSRYLFKVRRRRSAL